MAGRIIEFFDLCGRETSNSYSGCAVRCICFRKRDLKVEGAALSSLAREVKERDIDLEENAVYKLPA